MLEHILRAAWLFECAAIIKNFAQTDLIFGARYQNTTGLQKGCPLISILPKIVFQL